ncbi:DUF2750 domain-containing protein [Bacillus sp. 7884-1]|uniref:DUF2750 domain-containing protein n=1 Tax=Bacillus sp. 7884-1 TaxID=2021693 RepID=UPI000BA7E2D7|nr:DUF2750 domain-containing protein [Bacillus sp. 7884-1]PAE35438.1 hypothetical protein CHI06_23610 [Bacillus sp. 7884-1]
MKNLQYPRSGLRVRCEQGVNPKVRQSCLDFAKWLRLYLEFPIRVVVYLKKAYQIKTQDGKEMVSATFLGPYSKDEEPYIRVATGDFQELVSERGEENAILAILNSIAHEIIHYQQWLNNPDLDEENAETEAMEHSVKLMDEYLGNNFINEIIDDRKVWTIESEEGVPITKSDTQDSMPFWSSKLRVQEVINSISVYRNYKPLEISLQDFIENWIPNLNEDGLIIGANLNGESLIGHNWEPNELLNHLQYELDELR